jgi:DNA-binding NarL/FixJ family response regulator
MRKVLTAMIGRLDPIVARGLTAVLEDEARVEVLESGLGSAALERAVAKHAPSVAILGETVEYAVLERLKASPRPPGVLVVAYDPSRLYVTMLAAAGAVCVTLSAPEVEILAAVESAASAHRLRAGAGHQRAARRGSAAVGRLTPAEMNVLTYLKLGRSYVEIGRGLHISPATARSHSDSILKKLNVPRKRDLIGYELPPG